MQIAFFEVEEWEKEYLQRQLKSHKLLFFSDHLKKEYLKKIRGIDILGGFIYSAVGKEEIASLKNLKLISTLSTGYDHIDIEEAKKKNIAVCNVPYYGENTIAEHTFALILDLSRKIHKAYLKTSRGDFSLEGLRGFDLKGKTIGIIGAGHIGQHVARIAKGFEMGILVTEHKKHKELEKKFGWKSVPLRALLERSDVITLHVPYNKETHHIINRKNIRHIKKGALLINTARGGLIETDALIYALDNHILEGAGLDVLEGECFIKEEKQLLSKNLPKECDLKLVLENHILMQRDNVIITPHNAFNSKEALYRILDTTVENINAFARKKPVNRVM